MARIEWSLEEMILAAYAAHRNEWVGVNPKTPQVLGLSEILRRAKFHPMESRAANFRSANSVSYKINNLRASHPETTGKGVRKTEKESEVVSAFLEQPAVMIRVANAILRAIEDGTEYVGMTGSLTIKELAKAKLV